MPEALYAVVYGETKRLATASTFHAVKADESTDVSNLYQMVIHLRCVEAGHVTTRFGGIIAQEGQHATVLQEALDERENDIRVQWNTSDLGSDGASVFTAE